MQTRFARIDGDWRSLAGRVKRRGLKTRAQIKALQKIDCVYTPNMSQEEREEKLGKWHKAVERSLGWETL